METLNTLVQSRWKEGVDYHPYQAVERREALELILLERRKQLLFRGLRWMDIRRLNKEGEFPISVRRVIGGDIFELYPNDPRYVFQIPYAEIELTDISQNTRSESYE